MGQKTSIRSLVEQELGRQDNELPIIHEMASNLGHLLQDDNASVHKIATVIEKDPSLTAKVLNLSNSVFYSGVVKVKSVDRAISRVGMKPIRSFLMTVSMKNIFREEGSRFHDSLKLNWRHSLGCALGARMIAGRLKLRAIAEDAYLIGLLHDIGAISIFSTLNRLSKDAEKRQLMSEPEISEIVLSLHSPVGAQLLAKMNFDERFCAIVQSHHAYHGCVHNNDVLFNILFLANAVVNRLGISMFPDPELDVSTLPCLEVLGLEPAFIAHLEQEIEEGLKNMDDVL